MDSLIAISRESLVERMGEPCCCLDTGEGSLQMVFEGAGLPIVADIHNGQVVAANTLAERRGATRVKPAVDGRAHVRVAGRIFVAAIEDVSVQAVACKVPPSVFLPAVGEDARLCIVLSNKRDQCLHLSLQTRVIRVERNERLVVFYYRDEFYTQSRYLLESYVFSEIAFNEIRHSIVDRPLMASKPDFYNHRDIRSDICSNCKDRVCIF